MSKYECYVVRDLSGQVLYVGEGLEGRHKHATSGISHVFHLNKMYFEGASVDVEVFPLDAKEEAKFFEKALIEKHRPSLNTNSTEMHQYKSRIGTLLKRLEDKYESDNNFKTYSVYAVLKCAVENKITNNYEVRVQSKDFEKYAYMFCDTYHMGNVTRLMKRRFAKGDEVFMLFFDSITPVKGSPAYIIKLNPYVTNLKMFTLVDMMTNRRGSK